MKKYFYIASALVLFTACSKIDEEVKPSPIEAALLTPQTMVTDLPIVNIVVDETKFNEMYKDYYSPIELEASFSLYRNHVLVIENKAAEIEIKGSHTAQFELKSLGITLDDSYDNSDRSLLNPIGVLPFHNLDKIKAFRLRNSGNDFLKTNVKDICYTQMAIDAGLDIDLTYGEQMIVFVNNRLYGVMDMRSEGNSKGISRLYNTGTDNVDLAKIENPGVITFKTGDPQRLDQYVTAIEEKNLEFVKANTDISNFTDYMIFQSFIANYDWPYNNVRFYSIDGSPFRFVMYDLDWCNTVYLKKDPMYFMDPEKENMVTNLFLLLYEDADFKKQFDARYDEVIAMPQLHPASFDQRVDKFTDAIREEINYNIQLYGAPGSLIEWYQEVDLLKEHYRKRYDYFF